MLYQAKPANPVDYLGKWLLNVSQLHKENVAQQYKMAAVRAAQLKHNKIIAENEIKQQEVQAVIQKWTDQQ